MLDLNNGANQMLNRRGFITGLLAAPVILKTPGLIMSINSKNLMFDFRAVRPKGQIITDQPNIIPTDINKIMAALDEFFTNYKQSTKLNDTINIAPDQMIILPSLTIFSKI